MTEGHGKGPERGALKEEDEKGRRGIKFFTNRETMRGGKSRKMPGTVVEVEGAAKHLALKSSREVRGAKKLLFDKRSDKGCV